MCICGFDTHCNLPLIGGGRGGFTCITINFHGPGVQLVSCPAPFTQTSPAPQSTGGEMPKLHVNYKFGNTARCKRGTKHITVDKYECFDTTTQNVHYLYGNVFPIGHVHFGCSLATSGMLLTYDGC